MEASEISLINIKPGLAITFVEDSAFRFQRRLYSPYSTPRIVIPAKAGTSTGARRRVCPSTSRLFFAAFIKDLKTRATGAGQRLVHLSMGMKNGSRKV